MAAFASIAVQVDGLIGSQGILPVADYLDRAKGVLAPGPGEVLAAPNVALARARPIMCCTRFAGAACCWRRCCSLGFLPGLCAGLLWVFYLSIVVAGQVFLGYQWDSLLLEAGLLAVLMAPWRIRLGGAGDEPWWLSVWLVRWLAFRLMFQSGMVKLTSGDPAWSQFECA